MCEGMNVNAQCILRIPLPGLAYPRTRQPGKQIPGSQNPRILPTNPNPQTPEKIPQCQRWLAVWRRLWAAAPTSMVLAAVVAFAPERTSRAGASSYSSTIVAPRCGRLPDGLTPLTRTWYSTCRRSRGRLSGLD
jgi:phosphoketolase